VEELRHLAILLQELCGIHSAGLSAWALTDPVWGHSTVSKNRGRLLEGEIAVKKVKQLLSSDHLSVDGTL